MVKVKVDGVTAGFIPPDPDNQVYNMGQPGDFNACYLNHRLDLFTITCLFIELKRLPYVYYVRKFMTQVFVILGSKTKGYRSENGKGNEPDFGRWEPGIKEDYLTMSHLNPNLWL